MPTVLQHRVSQSHSRSEEEGRDFKTAADNQRTSRVLRPPSVEGQPSVRTQRGVTTELWSPRPNRRSLGRVLAHRRHRPRQFVVLRAVFVEFFLVAPIAAVRSHFGAWVRAAHGRQRVREKCVSRGGTIPPQRANAGCETAVCHFSDLAAAAKYGGLQDRRDLARSQ